MLKDHKAVMSMRLIHAALRSRVKHSTTEPLRFLVDELDDSLKQYELNTGAVW